MHSNISKADDPYVNNSRFMNQAYVDSFTGELRDDTPPAQTHFRKAFRNGEPVVLSAVHVPVGGSELVRLGGSFAEHWGTSAEAFSSVEVAGVSVLSISVLYAAIVVGRFVSGWTSDIWAEAMTKYSATRRRVG